MQLYTSPQIILLNTPVFITFYSYQILASKCITILYKSFDMYSKIQFHIPYFYAIINAVVYLLKAQVLWQITTRKP